MISLLFCKQDRDKPSPVFYNARRPQIRNNLHSLFNLRSVQYLLSITAALRPFAKVPLPYFIHINSQHIGRWLHVQVEHKI